MCRGVPPYVTDGQSVQVGLALVTRTATTIAVLWRLCIETLQQHPSRLYSIFMFYLRMLCVRLTCILIKGNLLTYLLTYFEIRNQRRGEMVVLNFGPEAEIPLFLCMRNEKMVKNKKCISVNEIFLFLGK